jgi:hypothetical protein
VYDGHLWYLMFDLCCELAMVLMLKSSDYRMKNHTVFLCVSEYVTSWPLSTSSAKYNRTFPHFRDCNERLKDTSRVYAMHTESLNLFTTCWWMICSILHFQGILVLLFIFIHSFNAIVLKVFYYSFYSMPFCNNVSPRTAFVDAGLQALQIINFNICDRLG